MIFPQFRHISLAFVPSMMNALRFIAAKSTRPGWTNTVQSRLVPVLALASAIVTLNTATAGDVLVLIGKDAHGSKIVPTNSITIPANEVLTFSGPLETFGRNGDSGYPPPAEVFGFTFKKDTFSIRGAFNQPRSFPGPGELKLDTTLCDACGTPSWATFQTNSGAIIRLTSSLQGFPPERTLVIPSGSPGASIGLEMSSDLLTWTPTQLGTYTAPTNHLFFRLKMQAAP